MKDENIQLSYSAALHSISGIRPVIYGIKGLTKIRYDKNQHYILFRPFSVTYQRGISVKPTKKRNQSPHPFEMDTVVFLFWHIHTKKFIS